MSDDYSDITPITINTEKELGLEFDNFNKILVDTTKDWNQRLNAIKRLEGMIVGGAFDLDGFAPMLTKLYLHINAQLNDLRSAITKEACRLVCMAAEFGQERAENLCDKLLSKQCLIKVINSATKIISDYGHECALCLLRNSKTPKVIPKILEEVSSKNNAVRQKIAQYIYTIVELFEEPVLEKYQSILEEAISTLIGDANKDVRQTTRQTFGIYANKFPPRGAKMFPSFDASVQKTLADEGLVDPGIVMKKALSITTGKETKSQARPSSVSAKKTVQSAGKMGETFNFASEKEAKSPELNKKSATLPRNGMNDSMYKKNRSNDFPPDQKASSMKESSRSGFDRKSPDNTGNGYVPVVKGSQGIGGKMSQEEVAKSMKSVPVKNYSSQRVPTKDMGYRHQESPNISRYEADMEMESPVQKEEELQILLENTSEEDWATRAHAFEQTNEFIANLKPHEQLPSSIMDDMIEAHIKHLNDYHYKVVIACQESFARLITIYNSKVLGYLDKIIPSLFINLTEGKDKVISSTNFLINLINKIYSGDELIPHFLKSLDSYSKIKYKTSLVEFMNILIRNCETYFNSPNAIKICVSKFSTIIGEFTSTKSIVMPCLGMILYLRDLNLNAAISAIGSLDMSLLPKVRALALEYAPDLEENIQVYLQQSKGIGKAEVRSPISTAPTVTTVNSTVKSPNNTANNYSRRPDSAYESQREQEETVKSSVNKSKGIDNGDKTNGSNSYASTNKGNKSSRNAAPPVTSPSIRSNMESNYSSMPKSKNMQSEQYGEMTAKQNEISSFHTDVDDFLQAESRAVQKGGEELNENQKMLSELVKIDSLISDFPKKKDEIQKKIPNIISTLSNPNLAKDQKTLEYSISIFANLMKLSIDFSKSMEQIIAGIISLYQFSPKNHALDDAMRTSLNTAPVELSIKALMANLEEADSPIAQILIKHITKLCNQSSQTSVSKILPRLIARYKELINHTNPDIRKNVVFSIVDLYFKNSQELQTYIDSFSANHQKLISIYIQKKSEGHATEPDRR